MKVVIMRDSHGKVSAVHSTHYYEEVHGKTEEDVVEAVRKSNEDACYERFGLLDIQPPLEEVMMFLLGDKGYKVYADMESLEESMNRLSAQISSIYEDVFGMSESMEQIEKNFKKMKEKFESLKNE